MRVLHREVGLTAENRLLHLDGGKIDRSAEALLNQIYGSAPFPDIIYSKNSLEVSFQSIVEMRVLRWQSHLNPHNNLEILGSYFYAEFHPEFAGWSFDIVKMPVKNKEIVTCVELLVILARKMRHRLF